MSGRVYEMLNMRKSTHIKWKCFLKFDNLLGLRRRLFRGLTLVSGNPLLEAQMRARASKSFFSMVTESLTDWACLRILKPYITICHVPFPCHSISYPCLTSHHPGFSQRDGTLVELTTGNCKCPTFWMVFHARRWNTLWFCMVLALNDIFYFHM